MGGRWQSAEMRTIPSVTFCAYLFIVRIFPPFMNLARLGTLVCLASAVAGAFAASPATPAKEDHEGFRLSDLLPRSLQRNPRLEISVLTEMSPQGKTLKAPDPAHPVYYASWDGGLVERGDSVAGERPPNPARLAAVMRQALAASGYLPASAEHLPTIVVHYRWGSYNHLTAIDDGSSTQSTGDADSAPSLPADDMADDTVRRNLIMRAALVGGPAFARDLIRAADLHLMEQFRMRDSRNDELVDMALGDLYFVVAVGYDAAAAHQGKAVALWTTKISTNSQGLAMDETLPALASSGRKFFGHETEGPVLTSPRLFGGKVEVGEPFVVKDPAVPPPPAPTANPASSK